MVIYKIIGIGIISCILVMQLKETRPDIAVVCMIASGVLIVSLLLGYVTDIVSVFGSLAESTGIDGTVFSSLLKMIGIGYITEMAASTVEDFGSKSIANKIILGGKITILVLAMPIITALIKLITSIV